MSRSSMKARSRPIRAVLACGAAATVVWFGPVAVAGAHEGKAIITVDTATPGDRAVSYELLVVWDNDGHPAKDATVTAVATRADGADAGPVAMQSVDDDGHYTGTLEFPSDGEWTVRFTVVEPPGTLDVAQSVTSFTTSSAQVASTMTVPVTTAVPTSEPTVATDSSGSAAIWIIAAAAALVSGGAVVADLVLRRRRRTRAAEAVIPETGSDDKQS